MVDVKLCNTVYTIPTNYIRLSIQIRSLMNISNVFVGHAILTVRQTNQLNAATRCAITLITFRLILSTIEYHLLIHIPYIVVQPIVYPLHLANQIPLIISCKHVSFYVSFI